MKADTPNHRDEWTGTELTVLGGMTVVVGLEVVASYFGSVTTRSLSIFLLAATTVSMTLSERKWRHTAANWRHINQGDGQ